MVDPETVVQLLRMQGETVTVTNPGEVIEDADGIPAWVAPQTVKRAIFAGVALTADEWEATALYLLEQLDATRE